jgi:hypothetical protein
MNTGGPKPFGSLVYPLPSSPPLAPRSKPEFWRPGRGLRRGHNGRLDPACFLVVRRGSITENMLIFVECDLRLPIGIIVTRPSCMHHVACLSRPRPSVSFVANDLIICKHSLQNSQCPTEPGHLVVSPLQRVVTHHRSLPHLDMLPSVMAAHMLFSPCTHSCGCGCAPIPRKISYHLFWCQGKCS